MNNVHDLAYALPNGNVVHVEVCLKPTRYAAAKIRTKLMYNCALLCARMLIYIFILQSERQASHCSALDICGAYVELE